ncbi:hypothetical protein R3P38DRAFT_492554 [Favolaschia claudopus]|uniref:Uncharacterized protein n=1 Tax=Favolaschia claudopus TaxID=2862362 RepID=A0AAW0CJN9_9AGAR
MSSIQLQMFAAQCGGMGSSTHPCTPPRSSTSECRTLRERCGWDLTISFVPVQPKGHLGPSIGNLPRRKRSSVVSIDFPAPVPAPEIVGAKTGGEFFV